MKVPRLLATLILVLSFTVPIQAEVLAIETWRGREAVRLTGPILPGTAGRFASIVDEIEPFPHKVPILLLDSLGGSVDEAMKMSRLMDLRPFHTVIPDGAKCASACASIVFIAGTYRTVEPFGALGQHSCSIDGAQNHACNEELAQHAVSHGVSHGSVAAFVTYVPPEEILWFSREDADGWGLTRYVGEQESGFEKSEPRVLKLITGQMPPAQAAWRIDFREDGYKAFLRPASDAERELQLNVFCNENLKGRLFMSMEIHGPSDVISEASLGLLVETDLFKWRDVAPVIWQADDLVSEVITEVPRDYIIPLLSKADALTFAISMKEPYSPIAAQTRLSSSGSVLRFAASNCASGGYEGPAPSLR
jgi:hypothetical protein